MTFSFFRQSYLTQLGSLKRGSRDENNGMKIVLNEPKRNIIVNFRQKRTEGQQLFKEKMAVENIFLPYPIFWRYFAVERSGNFRLFQFHEFSVQQTVVLYCLLTLWSVALFTFILLA